MSDPREPLAVFDDDAFAESAETTGLDTDELRSLTVRHQRSVRDLPGVDDIVYEWRNHFHLDPLVHRSERVYVLAVADHVWDEFGDRLDLSTHELSALKSVHDAQARTFVPESDRFDEDAAIVLSRP